uniref:F-box associated domain-containing protein n=1 Tax=Oryza brachyantha TaxID=4533 RepID=J3LF06_ORYBR
MPLPREPEKRWICGYLGVSDSGHHLRMIGHTEEEKLAACFDVLQMAGDCREWRVLYRVDLKRVKELYPGIQQKTRRHLIWPRRARLVDWLALWPLHLHFTGGTTTSESGQRGLLLFGIPGKILSYGLEDQEISVVWEAPPPPPRFFHYAWFNFYPYSAGLFDV